MKKLKKGIVLALALCLSMAAFSGCTDADKDADSSPSATPSASSSASPSASPSEEASKTEKDVNAGKEKVKLTMLLCSSGLAVPDGIDINDNEWTDFIKEWANVDLVIDQPLYADYDQKLQLRLSGGDLPDIVHCIGTSHTTTAPQAAVDGAFIDISEYYANSRNVKNVITEQMMEWSKNAIDGKNYYIPMKYIGLPQGSWLICRWDIVEQYNNGKWPETTPEWIALFEKIKQEVPDAAVLSNRVNKTGYALTNEGRVIYRLYGLPNPWSGGNLFWDFDNQKFENEFVTPEYKAATLVMKDLYEKGVLYKEFATVENYSDIRANKAVVAVANDANQVALQMGKTACPITGELPVWRMASPLKEFPAETRYPEVAYGTTTNGLSSHSMYISSGCKTPERAFDVLEVMSTEEFRDLCSWGIEGYSYKTEGDEKIPIPEVSVASLGRDDPNVFYWQRQFLTIWGFPSYRPYDEASAKLVDEEFANAQIASTDAIDSIAKNVAMTPDLLPGYVASDEENRKTTESLTEMSTITINFIMGKMSEADYDKAVADWQTKYGFIAEARTKYVNSYDKDEAAALGIKFTLD